MLVRHHVVLIFRVDGLEVGRDVDVVFGEAVLAEVFEEASVPRSVEVDICVGGVFILHGEGLT